MSHDVMPTYVGVIFAHACMQVLADDHGIDVLHIKGPAVDVSLLDKQSVQDADTNHEVVRPVPRRSVDADILVRPSHVRRLFEAMSQHGWWMVYDFADDSAFEHASTWKHRALAHVDVHRAFPGIGETAEAAFEQLWAARTTTSLGGQSCAVPDVTAQRLILILNAVRSGQLQHRDIANAWTRADAAQRRAVEHLAVRLQAEVALAAGSGRLEEYQDSREYELWKVLSKGDKSLARLWVARVKAQRTPAESIRVGLKLVLPNRNRMSQLLGHRPRAHEMLIEYLKRGRIAVREMVTLVALGVRRRSPGEMD